MLDQFERTPISEQVFYILLSLSAGHKHGYALMKDIETLSEGHVLLSTGTLYGAVKRLLAQGWIERAPDLLPKNGERKRKTYRLTKLGQQALNAEVRRLESLMKAAKRVDPAGEVP